MYYFIGKIDIKIYSCITSDITTDELIITDRQLTHITERHKGDFSNTNDIINSIFEAVSDPDYIIEANKPHSALILKQLSSNKRTRLVIRIKTNEDSSNYKNSIITLQKIREKEWNRLINNKKVLYKNK
ncbi:MAG: PBECR2 nuclease fold domain-containing protein [Eubacterium sp.]